MASPDRYSAGTPWRQVSRGVTRSLLLILLLSARLVSRARAGQALWAEGEAFFLQSGSRPPDQPPFGSRGECLGSGWGGRRGHWVEYRFRVPRAIPNAALYIRYARKPAAPSVFSVRLDGRVIIEHLTFKTTGGWGHLSDAEWRYRYVALGALAKGNHRLELTALADRSNTNIDGFFLCAEPLSPPMTRKEIEMVEQLDVERDPNRPTADTVDESLRLAEFAPTIDDWYYPDSERVERRDIDIPSVTGISEEQALVRAGNRTIRVPVGGNIEGWRLVALLPEKKLAVFEKNFAEWGLIVFVGKEGVVAEFRKAVGRLAAIAEPRVKLPRDYYKKLAAAKADVLGAKVLADGADPSYERVAGFLPDCVSYTFVGTPASKEKIIVGPGGVIGRFPTTWGKDKPIEHVLFDPGQRFENIRPSQAKRGLLGGWLPAANLGFYDPKARRGWEECVFAVDGESGAEVWLRVRDSEGAMDYRRLVPKLGSALAKDFYTALFAMKRQWDERMRTALVLDAPDPRVVDVSKACIAHALAGCVGLHPKYGLGGYWGKQHDTFPPTTLSLTECLLDWGLHDEARERLGYYLDHFIKADGSIDYYGPAVAEYGQFLALVADCVRQTGDPAWFDAHSVSIERLLGWVLRGRESAKRDTKARGLIWGSPEADTRKEKNFYFSGDCWCWRGMTEMGKLFVDLGRTRKDQASLEKGGQLLTEARAYRNDILAAAKRSVIEGGDTPFLPSIVGQNHAFTTMTEDRLASYTNYRYWLEALSAQCLGERYDRMMIDYRVKHGGELLGMTRFTDHLDDWPFYHYAYGILGYDRVREFLLGYFGHMAHHQTRGTFTAYEQVSIKGYTSRRYLADYCVPSQLVTPLMTRWMLAYEERDRDVLWLCRAVPRAWFANGFSFSGASTRWGKVGARIQAAKTAKTIDVKLTFARDLPPEVMLRLRHPRASAIASSRVEGAMGVTTDTARELIRLRPTAPVVHVIAAFE